MLRHCTDSQAGYSRKTPRRYMAIFRRERQAHHRCDNDRPSEQDRASTGLHRRMVLQIREWTHSGHRQGCARAQTISLPSDYRSKQDASKFDGCYDFGKRLGKLRLRVEKDLRRRKLAATLVLAAVVRLLDNAYFRVGNEQYAKSNKSFGANHAAQPPRAQEGSGGRHALRGKHGIVQEHKITDRSLVGSFASAKICRAKPCSNM